jgi:hypothetical protein
MDFAIRAKDRRRRAIMLDRSGAGRASLLCVRGGDDPDRVQQAGSGLRWSGTTDLFRLVRDEIAFERLLVTRSTLRGGRRFQLSPFSHVLNLIAEPERNTRSLENLGKLLRGYRGKVVNRPEAVLRTTRDQVAQMMQGIDGLVVPKVQRIPAARREAAVEAIARAGLRPPFILRRAGTHGGKIVGCFDSPEPLCAALEPGHDHIVVEFTQFGSDDGLYRKYRVFFLGGERVVRHMLVSDHWNVHAHDRVRFMATRPDLVAEERRLFEDNSDDPLPSTVSRALEQVRARMPLDFFGVDFGIAKDGSAVLFEANAAMSFFPLSDDPQFAYLRNAVPRAKRAFRRLLDLPETRPSASLAGMAVTSA